MYLGVGLCLFVALVYLNDKEYIKTVVIGDDEHILVFMVIVSLFIVMFGLSLKMAVHVNARNILTYTCLLIKMGYYILLLFTMYRIIGTNDFEKGMEIFAGVLVMGCLAREIVYYTKLGWRKLNLSIQYSKDRVAILVAIFGTIISLIIAFK